MLHWTNRVKNVTHILTAKLFFAKELHNRASLPHYTFIKSSSTVYLTLEACH